MARSLKKGYYVAHHLKKKIEALNASDKKNIVKTWSRRSMIIPDFIGHTISVHNGRNFIPVYVTPDMLGRKLGEFSKTRTFKNHTSGKKNKK